MRQLFGLAVTLAVLGVSPCANARDSFDLWRVPARHAQAEGGVDIMRPEPGRADEMPAQPRKRRGSSNPVYPSALPKPDHFVPTPSLEARPSGRIVQPYVVSPQSGQALPNLDQGRRESGQDRAVRCAHQAGVYGETGGSYLGTCINQ